MMRLASSLNRVFTGPLDAAMYLDLHLIPVVLRVAVASKPVRATRNRSRHQCWQEVAGSGRSLYLKNS
jgi:hypothetical protein